MYSPQKTLFWSEDFHLVVFLRFEGDLTSYQINQTSLNVPPDLSGCHGRQFEVPPPQKCIPPFDLTIIYMIGWRHCWFYHTTNSLDHPNASQKRKVLRLPASVRLSTVSCIYLTCFPITSDNRATLLVDFNLSPTERWTLGGSMSKDNRHDGRRRGAGQHRLGPRVSNQGGDGRERSGSNSSGSSHGGGKSKNASITALKVCAALCFAANNWSKTFDLIKNIKIPWYSLLGIQVLAINKHILGDLTFWWCDIVKSRFYLFLSSWLRKMPTSSSPLLLFLFLLVVVVVVVIVYPIKFTFVKMLIIFTNCLHTCIVMLLKQNCESKGTVL